MPKRALAPSRPWGELYDRLTGKSEEQKFVESIGRRREEAQNPDKSSEFFFDPTTTEIAAPAAMMTRYLNKGVPDEARRIIGTERFKEMAKRVARKIGDMRIYDAALEFAENFPRVAAHYGPTYGKERGALAVTKVATRKSNWKEMTPVEFSPRLKTKSANDIKSVFYHEGGHIAQEQGVQSRGLGRMYTTAEEALNKLHPDIPDAGYALNPSEISARIIERRKLGEDIKPYSMMEGMRRLVDQLPANSPERIKLHELVKVRP